MGIKTQQLEKIFDEGYCLVDLLPYIEYNQGVFVLSDGSLGKVWKIQMFETEGRDLDYLLSLSSHLENLLNRIPQVNLACQIILNSTPQIRDSLNEYENFKEDFNRESLFARGKVEHLEDLCKSSSSHSSSGIFPKKIDVYLTLRFFPDWLYPSFWQKTLDVVRGKKW
jgi:hypothetical protein